MTTAQKVDCSLSRDMVILGLLIVVDQGHRGGDGEDAGGLQSCLFARGIHPDELTPVTEEQEYRVCWRSRSCETSNR
jgi:hypothetical protein